MFIKRSAVVETEIRYEGNFILTNYFYYNATYYQKVSLPLSYNIIQKLDFYKHLHKFY